MYRQLDAPTQAIAAQLIDANLNFLQGAYQGQTYNLWEEEYGYSFFARSAQLRCFQAIAANTIGITVPAWLPAALTWLISALEAHWNGEVYQSVLPVPTDYRAPYDPNIDIVQAAVYGAESVTDPRLLATAAQLRAQWADPSSKYFYPINGADAPLGLGPLLGRYPGDVYDGDTDAQVGDHPWALTTANFAELYYRLAARITSSRTVPADSAQRHLPRPGRGDAVDAPAGRGRGAARRRATRCCGRSSTTATTSSFSEQFDAVTGFEKSVANLSWSYAAFLSAVRARTRGQLTPYAVGVACAAEVCSGAFAVSAGRVAGFDELAPARVRPPPPHRSRIPSGTAASSGTTRSTRCPTRRTAGCRWMVIGSPGTASL